MDPNKRQRLSDGLPPAPDSMLLLPADLDDWLSIADGSQTPAVLDMFHQLMNEQAAPPPLDDQLEPWSGPSSSSMYSTSEERRDAALPAVGGDFGTQQQQQQHDAVEVNPWSTTKFSSMKLYESIDRKGSVWKGSWNGRAVAVKMLTIDLATEANVLRRFTKQVCRPTPHTIGGRAERAR